MLAENHPAEKTVPLQRLNVIEDQIRTLSEMIEEDAPCREVLAHLACIRKELAGLAMTIVKARFRESVADAFDPESLEASICQCRAVMKYSKR